MPELIALYEDHAHDRDKFEVFAIHDPGVKSFAELDKKLIPIKRKYWQGKDLPFPVLLDAENKTGEIYGIHGWPTGLLIDPEGKLVGEGGVADLEAKLPRLPAAKSWDRRRDIQLNVYWSFEPSEYSPQRFAEDLQRWSRCEVALDTNALNACGLTAEGPLPGVVIGNPITLRSLEELLLAPHGLGVQPSADGNQLLITRRGAALESKNAESYSQKLRAKEIAERLDSHSAGEESKPLVLEDQPLLAAMKRTSREFDLPIALDAKAMQNKTLDSMAKVSGSVSPEDLRKSFVKLLEPLGLTVQVRSEVVLVTPVGQ